MALLMKQKGEIIVYIIREGLVKKRWNPSTQTISG